MKSKFSAFCLFLLSCLPLYATKVDLLMHNNMRLSGEFVSFKKDGITIKHPLFKKNITILTNKLKGIYFTSPSTANLQAKDKLFLANFYKDIIPCTIKEITPTHVKFDDFKGKTHELEKKVVAGIKLNAIKEQSIWKEPLIFDSSWLIPGKSDKDYKYNARKNFLSKLHPQINGDKYVYNVSAGGPANQQLYAPVCKDVGLNPNAFIFRTHIKMTPTDGNGPAFCFGGSLGADFRSYSNVSNTEERIFLTIRKYSCVLMRQGDKNLHHLGEIPIRNEDISNGIDIQLISSRNKQGKNTYELIIAGYPPLQIEDPLSTPLKGGVFAFQMEANLPLMQISKLQLASLSVNPESLNQSISDSTEVVLTNEGDAIPGALTHYSANKQILHLSLQKDYPNIPKELDIPDKYIESIIFPPETNSSTHLETKQPFTQNILLDNGSCLQGEVIDISKNALELNHPQLGNLALPLQNVIRIDYSDNPVISHP